MALFPQNPITRSQVMAQRHCFLQRNALLVRACTEAVGPADHAQLAAHGVGSSMLGPEPPAWLLKWAALVLEYIEVRSLCLGPVSGCLACAVPINPPVNTTCHNMIRLLITSSS